MMKIRVYDIECFNVMFYFLAYDPETKEYHSFEISRWKNDLYALCKYLEDRDFDYLVGYNSLSYDSQVCEFIVRNAQNWHDLNGDQICRKIKRFSNDTIHDSNYGLFSKYKEEELTVPQIDPFKIMHYDNENRRTSLKWLEYMMNCDDLEEMPFEHDDETLTRRDCLQVQDYCKKDVIATYMFYLYVRGQVTHQQYTGKDKVQDRLDIISEGLLPAKAINYSDSKIGDELNKNSYCKLTGKGIKDLYELKKSRKGTKKFTYGEAIPPYVQFKTKQFQDFYNKMKKTVVSLQDGDKQEFPFTYNGTTYMIARGGIHSNEKNRIIRPSDNEILRDADVGSQYPNAIKKRKLFPVHLGIEWNMVGVNNITIRMAYKEKGKTEKKYKGLSDMYKLALNSGYFGKTLEKTNWQYGPEVGYFCTIGNQFEILMLIEMLELEGIHCVSANTDGIVCLFDKKLEDTYYKICHEWERIVGNNEQGMLEYADFKLLAQESVNHYIGVKTSGELKIKGRFEVEGEIHKNNSDKISRIERKAIVNYFAYGTPIEKTIKESENIWDFVIGKKSSWDYRWETINLSNNQVTQYKKVIRFYISKDGEKLIKRKNENCQTDGAEVTQFFQGKKVTLFNRYIQKPMKDYNIDYDYYIDNIMIIVRKIESNRKKKIIINPNQSSLF